MEPRRFASVISPAEYQGLLSLIERGAAGLRDVERQLHRQRGGVAELLRTLLGYSRGAGVDARWLVISGSRLSSSSPSSSTTSFTDTVEDPTASPTRASYERTLAHALELLPLFHHDARIR